MDLKISLIFLILSIIIIGYSVRKINKNFKENKIPLLGVVSAGIFAAQMLNWPIPGGTSAHFVGGALAGIILGPYLGCLSMFSVILIQALLFGDGGIIVLGANIWNMAIINVFFGYYTFKLTKRYGKNISAFLSGWIGITAAAIFMGIQTGFSSTFGYNISQTVLVMGGSHALLGIIEGGITSIIYRYFTKDRPDLELKELKIKDKSKVGK